jgi:hypothetical protein
MRIRLSHRPEWLIERGYEGLCDPHESCGCSVDDFAPCGDGPFQDCVPAEERDGLFFQANRRRRAPSQPDWTPK